MCCLLIFKSYNIVSVNKKKAAALTLRLLIATIVALKESANSKACHTYYIPHATIQSKCSHTGVNIHVLSYKHVTFY